MQEEKNLGSDSIKSLLFSLSLPAIVGQLVSLIYNVVDRAFIGHIPKIGGLALTGVGLTSPLVIIIASFAALVGMGGAPQAAIKMGQGDNRSAENILGNSFSLLLIFSISLTLIFTIFSEKFLLAFGASPATLPYALEYMKIYSLGAVFTNLSLGLNAFISTQGFSKTSMLAILIGALTNIILDPIFIFVLDLGVKGAALATVLSQFLSAFWIISFLRGPRTKLRLKREFFSLKSEIILPMLGLGLAPFVMQMTESLLFMTFNSSLQKYGGDVAVGAMTILGSAMQFVFLPLFGLSQGAQPIISYNYGAGKIDRVKKTFKYLFLISIFYSTSFWMFCMISPKTFVSIWTKDQAIIEMGTWALRIYIGGAFALGVQESCQQTFIALGNAKTSLFLATLRKIILLIPFIYIFPRIFSDPVFAVFLAEPIADILAATTTGTMFFMQFDSMLMRSPGLNKQALKDEEV